MVPRALLQSGGWDGPWDPPRPNPQRQTVLIPQARRRTRVTTRLRQPQWQQEEPDRRSSKAPRRHRRRRCRSWGERRHRFQHGRWRLRIAQRRRTMLRPNKLREDPARSLHDVINFCSVQVALETLKPCLHCLYPSHATEVRTR